MHTGSGVALDAIVRLAKAQGHEQRAVFALPKGGSVESVGGLSAACCVPIRFGEAPLDFAVPGMSDVMPYESSVFSALSVSQVQVYVAQWRAHLDRVIRDFAPDVIHSHHLWIVSGLVCSLAGEVPVVLHCHGTGLRQLDLCPHLRALVVPACRGARCVLALHAGQRQRLVEILGEDVNSTVVGSGYRSDVFGSGDDRDRGAKKVVYAGKLSRSKGLPWLLHAVERAAKRRAFELHIAGGGAGGEADEIRERLRGMGPGVVWHGTLAPNELADLMREAHTFVLPSMYEGLPLVLVEAAASGCRLISTALPGVVSELGERLASILHLVPLPRLVSVDEPDPRETAVFTDHLEQALVRSLDQPRPGHADVAALLQPFTWRAVFQRVEAVYRAVTGVSSMAGS